MILALLAFTAMQQPARPVDPVALPTCIEGARHLEEFVGDYREFINGYERAGQLSYDFAADLEYELELRARPHIEYLKFMAHDPEVTRYECRDFYVWANRDLVDNITSKRLANFNEQRKRRLGL